MFCLYPGNYQLMELTTDACTLFTTCKFVCLPGAVFTLGNLIGLCHLTPKLVKRQVVQCLPIHVQYMYSLLQHCASDLLCVPRYWSWSHSAHKLPNVVRVWYKPVVWRPLPHWRRGHVTIPWLCFIYLWIDITDLGKKRCNIEYSHSIDLVVQMHSDSQWNSHDHFESSGMF